MASIKLKLENKKELDSLIDTRIDKKTSNNLITNLEGFALDARQGKVLDEKVKNVSDKVDTINGSGEGSFKKYVDDAIVKLIANAPASLDTLKEISDWISGHETSAASMNSSIKANASSIATLQSDLKSHTHLYAGSSNAGGAATSANKLNTDAGSTTQPVYFSNGVPVKCSYTLEKSVPSNAVFTDTTALGSMTGILSVSHGGTGASTLTAGAALIGNGTSAVATRSITNMTSVGHITYNTNLMTTNTLAYWNGAYNSDGTSNLVYCKHGSIGTAATKSYTDSSSASAIGTGTSVTTERDVYHGLPTINGSHSYTSNTNIYAPTSVGTNGYVLKSAGTGAPSWVAQSTLSAGTATYATNSGTASYSSNGAKATSATSATYATTATNSGTATYATKAGTATYATNSGTASYSSNGAKATSATSATYSSTAVYAKSAPTYKGATTAASGTVGLVPAATTATRTNFLRGDGTWAVPSKATSATSATYATTATKAGTATYASNSGTASYASNIVNNLTTTGSGYALDARQGKTLNDSKLNKSWTFLNSGDAATGVDVSSLSNGTEILVIVYRAINGVIRLTSKRLTKGIEFTNYSPHYFVEGGDYGSSFNLFCGIYIDTNYKITCDAYYVDGVNYTSNSFISVYYR